MSPKTEALFAKCRVCGDPTSVFLPNVAECHDCWHKRFIEEQNRIDANKNIATYDETSGKIKVTCPICNTAFTEDEKNIQAIIVAGKCEDCAHNSTII